MNQIIINFQQTGWNLNSNLRFSNQLNMTFSLIPLQSFQKSRQESQLVKRQSHFIKKQEVKKLIIENVGKQKHKNISQQTQNLHKSCVSENFKSPKKKCYRSSLTVPKSAPQKRRSSKNNTLNVGRFKTQTYQDQYLNQFGINPQLFRPYYMQHYIQDCKTPISMLAKYNQTPSTLLNKQSTQKIIQNLKKWKKKTVFSQKVSKLSFPRKYESNYLSKRYSAFS